MFSSSAHAGLDVHKDTVVAAVRLIEGDGSVRREVETFATTTPGLLAQPRGRPSGLVSPDVVKVPVRSPTAIPGTAAPLRHGSRSGKPDPEAARLFDRLEPGLDRRALAFEEGRQRQALAEACPAARRRRSPGRRWRSRTGCRSARGSRASGSSSARPRRSRARPSCGQVPGPGVHRLDVGRAEGDVVDAARALPRRRQVRLHRRRAAPPPGRLRPSRRRARSPAPSGEA